jgi:hypothetical protein
LGFWPPLRPRARAAAKAVAGAFGHQGVLELGDRAADLKEHPADRRRRVKPLVSPVAYV